MIEPLSRRDAAMLFVTLLMEKIESLQDFYKRKFDQVPGIVSGEIGHFNLFRLEPYVEGKPTNIPYRRRDFIRSCS
jgi:hypothetical protein